ncbi:hypothetical protein A7X95_04360 [Candidatus Nitrosopelagicus brevis]|uniref:Uncharacterized protein n=1 Tax=Candidatus Nitrosopelagicus brevis TaxID=1410606 RepID=A0A0A7V7M7_9ARCH|nr:hypothetical protein [Candidatus Nitrosopelagicus brevis]AJA92645.1 hypothetical protein T478_1340 [Candidatus Nitrosopelagicus brevis]PTL87155.1 hypothetical protein A7X95_04360 [Candidatus Nitrosopelagicus brevis]
MNTKIIGIIILVVAIGGASAYFITKNDPVETNSFSNQPISQNEKISLVINTINPPKSIDDLEESYKIASTSGVGRTNLYVYWSDLEPEKGNFDWRVTDIMMKLNEKYNLKTTLFFSVINADRLGPFPLWMGNQALGETLEDETIRVLDSILSRYENIDYVIFSGDIDYHFQRASGSIPTYVNFFDDVYAEIKSKHHDVKIGNSISLENVINKGMGPGGSFELTPKLEMGDFIALSYKPTDVVGDIDRTPQEALANLEQSLEIFPSQQLAFFEISWSTSDFVNGNDNDQAEFIKSSLNFFEENESKIEFFTISRLFDKPKGSCASQEIESIGGSGFASNSFRLERVDEYVCNSGLIDTNENAKPAWMQFKSNITQ